MNRKRQSVILGGLLHDIGKVLYREGGERKKHSRIGYNFLVDTIGLDDKDILDCVRYHHSAEIQNASLKEDSLAYIVYMADNIASAADRRKKDEEESGFDLSVPLSPVFNLLHRKGGDYYYSPYLLNEEKEINFPIAEKKAFTQEQYQRITENISDNLKGLNFEEGYINSLLEVLEGNLSYVPSSTSKREVSDISLYDHLKLTAAFAGCIQEYIDDAGLASYKQALWTDGAKFYETKAFLLASMDISGIQKFIYTIATKKALKTLRARSFYLEIFMEHIIDEMLDSMELSRANLIYCGGGHCYLLLPNTAGTIETFNGELAKVNAWLLEQFQDDLYVAGACVPCSSNDLKNEPDGSYAALFHQLSEALSEKKGNRYSAEQIIALNRGNVKDYTRECRVCKRAGVINEEGECPMCEAFAGLSKDVLGAEFFSVEQEAEGGGIPLPGGYYLVADSEATLRGRLEQGEASHRVYGKNRMFTGQNLSTKLWVGAYTTGETLEELAQSACGIHRIAVLRADVDDLGHAFVSGFEDETNHNRYVTLSRTATLSRQLSLFFKRYINIILEEPEFSIHSGVPKPRKATIVYSGGDDLFIVGAWDDVIGLAVDIRRQFEKYTLGTLSISAGVELYPAGYPISVIAEEVAQKEEQSKRYPGKNAITILEDGEWHRIQVEGGMQQISDATYSWREFENEVVGEKLAALEEFFGEDYGNSFLYHLLELIRNQKDRIYFARVVYLLSRMEPDRETGKEKREAYRRFSNKILSWIQEEAGQRQLKTAMTMYVYLHREMEEKQ